jgi:hypothetical protein
MKQMPLKEVSGLAALVQVEKATDRLKKTIRRLQIKLIYPLIQSYLQNLKKSKFVKGMFLISF